MYPLPLADATPERVQTIFTRFVELRSVWSERFAGMIARAQERAAGAPEDDEDEGETEGEPSNLVINP